MKLGSSRTAGQCATVRAWYRKGSEKQALLVAKGETLSEKREARRLKLSRCNIFSDKPEFSPAMFNPGVRKGEARINKYCKNVRSRLILICSTIKNIPKLYLSREIF